MPLPLPSFSSRRVLAAAAVAVGLVLAAVLLAAAAQFRLVAANLQRQAQLSDARLVMRDHLLQMVNEETAVRGYVATGDEKFLEILVASRPRAAVDAQALAATPLTSEAITSVRREAAAASAVQHFFDTELRLIHFGGVSDGRARLHRGKELFDAYRATEARAERHMNAAVQAQRQRTASLARVGFIGSLLLAAGVVAATLIALVALRRVRQYERLALFDPLTGIRNRRAATDVLHEVTAGANAALPFGLVFVDLDGFKKLNDSYGHAAGDAVLRTVAQRLTAELRHGDGVFRIGGDEFLCIINPPAGPDELRAIAQRLRAAIGKPYEHGNDVYVVGSSIGLSFFPQHGTSAEELLARADAAMYDAKSAGGGIREAA